MSKLTLYGIWLSGPTYKAGLALSLMGQPFTYKHVDLRAGAHKQPEYLAINRFGQVPALVDGDLKLCQSGSILLYLADKFGKMGGKTPEEKARVREWLFWEFDRLAPNVYRPRAMKRGFMKLDDNLYQLYSGLAGDALKVLDAALAKSPFLVGNEHAGLSPEARAACDDEFSIPLYGLSQSVNLSVATGIMIYAASEGAD